MQPSTQSTRFYALDALRGLTIALMILVNTPGSWNHIYAPFRHADWHGCTPTDLVFPFFMFIVGAAMYFSFSKTACQWTNEKGLKILKRTCIIFAIGLFLNAYPFNQSIENLRILGVLQRIALAYGMAAVLVLLLSQRGIYIASAAILLLYWLLMVLGGGEVAFALEGNLVTQIDKAILGDSHLWQGKGMAFDPEGLLSTFPSVVNVLIGFEIARWLTSQSNQWTVVQRLVIAGVVMLAIGYLWGLVMPINKSLWTSTFVVYTAGYFALTLAFFIWLVDIKKWNKIAQPLIIYGSNPLFIYALAAVWTTSYFLFQFEPPANNLYHLLYLKLTGFLSPVNASLLFAVLHVLFFWCISWVLYKKRIFIKV